MSVKIFDIIPVGDSAERAQNSEPSLAVNPNDPIQIIAGSFAVDPPFFLTTGSGFGASSTSHGFEPGRQTTSMAYNNLNNYGSAPGQGKTASVNVSAMAQTASRRLSSTGLDKLRGTRPGRPGSAPRGQRQHRLRGVRAMG
jgi:hypothetical protein